MHKVHRYHDFSAGHRVVGHENKCKTLHGHNYRIHFTCAPSERFWKTIEQANKGLDELGRVIDFGVMKETLCQWLEDNWDHKTLLWDKDPMWDLIHHVTAMDSSLEAGSTTDIFHESFIEVPFNPTAENMAEHLVTVVGPELLQGTGVTLIEVTVDETRKCSATYTL